jgi:hypothetical protein
MSSMVVASSTGTRIYRNLQRYLSEAEIALMAERAGLRLLRTTSGPGQYDGRPGHFVCVFEKVL